MCFNTLVLRDNTTSKSEAIPTLSETWKDVNTILNKISALKVSPSDKHKSGIDVLTTDIREILDTIGVQKSMLDQGSR